MLHANTIRVSAFLLGLHFCQQSNVAAFTGASRSLTRAPRRGEANTFQSTQQRYINNQHDPSLFASTVEEAGTAEPSTTSSFVSPMFQCNIEDTDSYGMMYNANYLRVYDRALHTMYTQQDSVNIVSQKGNRQSMMNTHEDWSIVRVNNQQFKTPTRLGGTYCVHGTLVEHQDDLEVWDLTMRENENLDSNIFNSARVTIARPGIFAAPSKTIVDDNASVEGALITKDIFRLYRDEFDAHFPTHIPLRNVFNLFERARSNHVGGPDCLRKLKEDHGLLFVVSKIDNCCKFPFSNDSQGQVKPGQLVVVETVFHMKRKGMIIDCHQLLKAENQPVAQATVTLMTIDASTFKPSNKLPDWLRELMASRG